MNHEKFYGNRSARFSEIFRLGCSVPEDTLQWARRERLGNTTVYLFIDAQAV